GRRSARIFNALVAGLTTNAEHGCCPSEGARKPKITSAAAHAALNTPLRLTETWIDVRRLTRSEKSSVTPCWHVHSSQHTNAALRSNWIVAGNPSSRPGLYLDGISAAEGETCSDKLTTYR